MSDEMTGPERIREAIRRDRGGDAPAFPIQVCGPACRGDDLEAYIAERGPEFAEEVRRAEVKQRRRARLGCLICPGCLGLRFGPAHLSRKLVGIDCQHT